MSTLTGKVKWWDEDRGFGFISRDGAPDLFVHYSAIIGDGHRSLAEGDVVEFEVEHTPRGPAAARVMQL